VKKSKKIGEIDPESTVQASRIQATIHERIVPLDHHEPFALQTIHDPNVLLHRSSDPVHDQRQATGQETSTEDCGSEGEVWTRSAARMCPIEQITYAPLNHQDRQGKNRANAKPP
jgi:hypothetical protein